MKKTLAFVLVLCLMFSLSVSAFAAELTPDVDKTTVEAGADVTVTLTLSEEIAQVKNIGYKLRYNGDLFEFKNGAAGETTGVVISRAMNDKTSSFVRASFVDTTSAGVTMKKGVFATLTFTAKASISANTDASFSLVYEGGDDVNGEITHTAGAAASVTVTPAGYEVTLYGQILGSSINEKFADITGTGNGEEYTCLNTDKKTGLDVIKGVLDAKGYTYVATATAITSVTDKNGVTLKNGDETYGPKSGWTFTINGEKPGTYGITTLNEYVLDDETMGYDGDEFHLIYVECDTDSGKHTFGDDGVCTVCGKSNAVAAEYTLTMGEDKTVKANENVMIPVTVGYTTDAVTSFNAVDMQFAYDTAKLEFVSVSDTTNYTVKAENGIVRVQGYGENKALGEAFTLTFKALASTGESGTLVTATSAKIDEAKNAVTENAPEAKLLRESTKITIDGAVYSVTLPAGQFTGAETVNAGEDYTFKASNEHYDYSKVTATMGGAAATVKDNGDGTFTIENVTGDITVNKVLGKKYTVTLTSVGGASTAYAEEARYGEDYKFQINNVDTDTYDYSVTVTIGGKTYVPTVKFIGALKTYIYSIAGDAITGNIEIVATRTLKGQNTTQISFTGSGAAEVEGGTTQTATNGQDFQFTVNKETGYDYTVKLGDEILTAGTDGKYVIPAGKLTGTALTVTVEKTFSAQNVNVQKYVNLDNTSIWLVSVSGTAGDGKVFTYGGAPMYTSAKYAEGGTHVYLVIAETLSKEDAAKNIAVKTGTAAGTVDYSGDVNGSKTVDINDAQLVYDMYNAKYAGFDAVTMYKFLCADVSDSTPEGATLLNVNDAVVVVKIIK